MSWVGYVARKRKEEMLTGFRSISTMQREREHLLNIIVDGVNIKSITENAGCEDRVNLCGICKQT
jgi:hypothetical protein